MASNTVHGAAKRFGARYGRRLRDKFAGIEFLHRKAYKCPECSKEKVRRIAAGIWQCRHCNLKIAGKAYTIERKRPAIQIEAEAPKLQGKKQEKEMGITV